MSSSNDKPFKRFVRMVARAFYDEPPPVDKKLKPGQSDNSGIGVIVMDALTKVEWIKEEDLATQLRVRRKQIVRVLQTFEREKLINREHRQESVDVARYRIYHIKKKLKGLLDKGRETIPCYICTKCNLRFSAFEVMDLLSDTDDAFHCDKCDTIIIAERAAMKEEDEEHRLLLEKVEEQLKPLTDQLALLKNLCPPDYVSLQAWEASHAVHVPNESQGKTIPSIKEEKVRMAENSKGNDAANVKSLPPWMIKQEMNLTDEQRGEVKGDSKDEKATDDPQNDDQKSVKEKYWEAYRKEIKKLYQSENSKSAAEDAPTERRVGQKAKREDSDEEESDQLNPFATGVDSETIDKDKTSSGSHAEAAHKEDDGDNDDDIEWE